jgi:hypothetical protein
VSGNRIPGGVRVAVRGRDRQHCVRCGMKGAEIHHRRSKSVQDEHTHCTCNLIYLCGWGNHTGCHGWAHSNPFEAKASGLIVLRSVADPWSVPVMIATEGLMVLDCEGHRAPLAAMQEAGLPLSPTVDLYPTEP